MKKVVWTFGLISGVAISAMMLLTVPFHDAIGFDRGYIVGYTTMVLAFLFIFFGIRSYRDNVGGGSIGFGRAMAVGTLIAVIASVCYTATWEVVYFKLMPDFAAKYTAYEVAKVRSSGASQAEIDKRIADLQQFEKMYRNPVINAGFAFIEPLPVGLIISLVSAGILRRRRREGEAAMADASLAAP